MKKTKIEAPWYTYNKKVAAIFEQDPDVIVGEIGEDTPGFDYYFTVAVVDHEKALALDKALRHEQTWGNVTLGIFVEDVSQTQEEPDSEMYKIIFKGNPILKDVAEIVDPAKAKHTYVRFAPEVVQFYDDDLTDYNGNWNGLAEDIAREIFTNSKWNVQFCTADKNENK